MHDYHSDEILGKAYDSLLIKRLWRYVIMQKLLLVLSLMLLPVVAFLELSQPYLIKIAIDGYILKGEYDGLKFISLIYFLVMMGEFAARYCQTIITQLIGQRVTRHMRDELFSHLTHLSLAFFNKNPVGRLVTRLTNDIEVINEMFSSGVIAIFGDLFTLVGIIAAMLYIDSKLALYTFSTTPLIIAGVLFYRKRGREAFRQVRMLIARINAYLQENVSGIREVQIFRREKRNLAEFAQINLRHQKAEMKAVGFDAFLYSWVEMVGSLAIAIIIWFGGGEVIKGWLTFGVLVAFIEYIRKFFIPIRDLSAKYTVMQSAMASLERIFTLLDNQDKISDPVISRPIEQLKGEIEFRDVWFAYETNQSTLKGVSFRVPAGNKIAIVGATGAGKTTIIKLLGRYYEPQRGEILLDGINIRDIPKKELRSAIGTVWQDEFLFSGDILKNIILSRQDISLDEIKKLAKVLGADGFIERLPGHYEEAVRERGSNFSSGERQLISFLRVMAFNPKILVLDEATSQMDSATEQLLQQAINILLQARTAIIIAHRLSTIRMVDQILVVHQGEIAERGTHEELLAKEGLYYNLYQMQYQTAS